MIVRCLLCLGTLAAGWVAAAGWQAAIAAGWGVAAAQGAERAEAAVPAALVSALAEGNWREAERVSRRWMEQVWCDVPGEVLRLAKLGRWDEVQRLLEQVPKAPDEWVVAALTNFVCGVHASPSQDRLLLLLFALASGFEEEASRSISRAWADAAEAVAQAYPGSVACQFWCAALMSVVPGWEDEAERCKARALRLNPADGWAHLLLSDEPTAEGLERAAADVRVNQAPLGCVSVAVGWEECGRPDMMRRWLERGAKVAWGRWLSWTFLQVAALDEADDEAALAGVRRIASTLVEQQAGWAWDAWRLVLLPLIGEDASEWPSFAELVEGLGLE